MPSDRTTVTELGTGLGMLGLADVDEGAFGRIAEPMEIAGAVRFLVSPDASFVNGSAFVVDGGLLAKLAID
jgi:NAD(P)-dependent dehydrogenase (short-subunit alcohol dehydrogenase family)